MGNHTVMASWIRNDVKEVADKSSDLFAVGYTYGFSKRTNLYASYAHVANENNVKLYGGAANGESVNRVSFGLRHQF